MPNWCMNNLYIENAEKHPGLGEDLIIEGRLSFAALLPQPTELPKKCPRCVTAVSGYTEWYKPSDTPLCSYHWNIANWGCKSDASDQAQAVGSSHIFFETPWGPPEAWFRALCAKYPTLDVELHFEEPGMDIRGAMRNQSGVTIYGDWILQWREA